MLEGFEAFSFCDAGAEPRAYRRGTGPGVVFMHEIPGITPPVADFAKHVAESGFTVFVPKLFGIPGKP